MQVNYETGLLNEVEYHFSPNQDERPDCDDITGIVVHNISLPPGEFGGGWIDDLFLNQLDPTAHPYFQNIAQLKVSAHVLIRRNGEIIQYVPFHKRAWHAGVSCWNGRERCNDFTIGIELEGCDDKLFEPAQYQQLASVIKALCACYPQLNYTKIVGHQAIAPDRKTDPGPFFDWNYLDSILNNKAG
ncbi:MAG: 1,6-anhydro-N-acetylmuramyl-L-alanine amidase AmpD [Gammaproteobacteria bacterium]|nr:1,6-anhydro-N-acetylmuramyl-L-alanine amidase AmpD [Gammaproteobacteria bacterium]MDT8371499.1 1,6-anhydro-N-acetylmuramyl-L-alanine amidase AmpD [Gammaproteobacteria bacterium]